MITNDIIISDDLRSAPDPALEGHLLHAWCPQGSCRFVFNEREYTLRGGDCMIIPRRGDCREHREVKYYADALCVTPKYLSEVCRLVSGYSASYWIARYTALDISRQLRDRTLSIEAVADLFHFSSLSHFSRYVQWYAVGSADNASAPRPAASGNRNRNL